MGGSRRDRRVPKGVLALALAMFLYAMASCAYETNISLHIGGPYAGDPTVSGIVCAINEELEDSPENLNSDPYGAWIIKVESVTGEEELLDAAAYEAFCAEEG